MTATDETATDGAQTAPGGDEPSPLVEEASPYAADEPAAWPAFASSSRVSVLFGLALMTGLVTVLLVAPVSGPRPTALAAAAADLAAPEPEPPLPVAPPCPAAPEKEVEFTPVTTPGDNTVALTFDDGPGEFTPQVLDILSRERVRATFFVLGTQVEQFPDLVRRMIADGHQLGNHTHRHVNLRQLPPERQEAELDAASAAIEAVTGRKPCVFRPPYGSFSPTTVAIARARNMTTVMWAADTNDWKAPGSFSPSSRDSIQRSAELGAAHPNPVVLMHDAGGNPVNTIAALPGIIDFYRGKGYRFVDMNGESWDGTAPAIPQPAEGDGRGTTPVDPADAAPRAWKFCLLQPAPDRCGGLPGLPN